MGKQKTDNLTKDEMEIIQDSVSVLATFIGTQTPYNGYLMNFAQYGYIGNAHYYKTNIVVLEDKGSTPKAGGVKCVKEKLSYANTATSLMSFLTTTAGYLQANALWYLDAHNNLKQTTKEVVKAAEYTWAKDLGNVGKNFGKAFSYVNIAIIGIQVAVDRGFNVNTGADTMVCAVGFVPYVGWVIAGVYTIANIVVTAITDKSISEHTISKLFDIWCKLNAELERYFNPVNMMRRYGF